MSAAQRFTDGNFEQEVLRSELPVLVDFWASWCPPCKMVEPLLTELAEECLGKVKIGKLHVDQNPVTASRYRIEGVPTFILFYSGRQIQQRIGAQSKGQLREMIKEALRRFGL